MKCWLDNTKETADVKRPESRTRSGVHIENPAKTAVAFNIAAAQEILIGRFR